MAEILDKSAKQTNDVTKKLAINNFKLSPCWLNHFLKHHDLLLQHKTKIAQKLPEDLEDKYLIFSDVSEDIIGRAFKKYGISNCLSRSEDHLIYNDDDDENSDNESDRDNNSNEGDESDEGDKSDEGDESDDDDDESGNEDMAESH
ncbi:23475_t:CDS:2, partial [Cetraspora pellucida]